MSKFKQTLKIIEEGLLKPMSDADIKQVEDEELQEWISKLKSEMISKIKAKSESIDDFIRSFPDENRHFISDAIYNAAKDSDISLGLAEIVNMDDVNDESMTELFDNIPEVIEVQFLENSTVIVIEPEILSAVTIDDYQNIRSFFLIVDIKKLEKLKFKD